MSQGFGTLSWVRWREEEGLSMTGIPLVQSEAPTDKFRRMKQRLYRILHALRSLRPSCCVWLLRTPCPVLILCSRQ